MAAEFVPPMFADFGSDSSDLFSKDYKFSSGFKSVSKTASGLTFETHATLKDKKGVVSPEGKLVASYKDKKFGSVKADISTGGKASAKVALKKLAKNTTVTLSAKGDPAFAIAAEYRQDFISADIKADFQKAGALQFDRSATIGSDGLSVGGCATFARDAGDKKIALDDYNLGTQYAGSDYVAAIQTDKSASVMQVSYFHQVSKLHQVGALFSYDTNKDSRSMTLGTQYKIDSTTTVKVLGKTSGEVWVGLKHKLAAPRMDIGVAAQFNASSYKFNAEKFGVNFSFGN